MADRAFNQSVSEGLMGQGLTQLGSIAAVGQRPEIAGAVVGAAQQTAASAVQAMRQRYWQSEYKEFSKAYIDPAHQAMQEIQMNFDSETKVALRMIANPVSQADLQAEANAAVKAAPGPETDAKASGPAGATPPGIGVMEYSEQPAMINPDSGAPIPMGTMDANEAITAAKGKALQASQAITMKLMDSMAEFPNNPFVQQAATKMFENLQQQLQYASTGRADAMEAAQLMMDRKESEANVEKTYAESEVMRQETGIKGKKEAGLDMAAITEAAKMADIYPKYYGDRLINKLENPESITPEDVAGMRAINEVTRDLYGKQVEAGLTETKRLRIIESGKNVDSATFPSQIRGSDPYKQALGEAMQPVMVGMFTQWDNDPAWRTKINAPEHLRAEESGDTRVIEFLMQHAQAMHPEVVDASEDAAFNQIYGQDPGFRERVMNDLQEAVQTMQAGGEWHSGLAATFREDPIGMARALTLNRPYVPLQQPVSAATVQQPAPDLPQGGSGMLMSHMAPAAPLTRKPAAKPAGPGYEWLKGKVGTGHPASQETNTPKVKKAVVPSTKRTQPTDTKAKKAKKTDAPAAQDTQPTDSKKGAKPGSPRLQVKKPGGTGVAGGYGGGLSEPPKWEKPVERTRPLGKVELDPSRLRHAVAAPPNVKSLEDFIKAINEGLGSWAKSHKEKELKYKSRFDTRPR